MQFAYEKANPVLRGVSFVVQPGQTVAILGATADLGLLWSIAETFNGLMSIPNLIALFLLSGTLLRLTRGAWEARRRP